MRAFDFLIRGNVVLPDEVIHNGYVAVLDGRVAAVGDGILPAADQQVNADGQWILPGLIDGHVHSGSQAGREGIGTATRAAAAGGITTIADMPYDDPDPVIDATRFRQKVSAVNKAAHVDVALYGTIAKQNGLAELPGLIEAGACAFKFSTFETHPQRFPRISPPDLLRAFQLTAPAGLACAVHCEDQEMVDRLLAELKASGCTEPHCHGISRPPLAESLAIAGVYEIGAASGGRAHVVHCSIGRGIEICETYRKLGTAASIETCVQYLTLCEDDLDRLGAKGKVNPPLRSRREVESLWQHLAEGRIDFVASDHVAWGLERKNRPNFLENVSGFPGLESLLPAFYTGCLQHNLPITAAAHYLAEKPARHFRLFPQKGSLLPGSDADITLLEEAEWIFDASKTQTAADWSPYDGLKFAGRVRATFVRGVQVWDGSQILVDPGYGRFVRPKLEGHQPDPVQ